MALLHRPRPSNSTCSPQRAHKSLRPLGARQATPVRWAPAHNRVQQLLRQQQVGLAASDAAVPAQQPSSGQQQHPKYRGVTRRGSTWRAQITIPRHLLPGSQKLVVYQIYGYDTPEAAAHAADLQLLALHGDAALPHLNFPADSYSEEEVADQQAVLLAKYPGLQLGGTAKQPGLHRSEDRSGALAAAARAAERVGSVYDGSSQLTGTEEVNDAASDLKYDLKYGLHIGLRHNASLVQYWLQPLTYLAAGCGYDMAHIVLFGPHHSVNFPPDVYSSSDIEAMRQDMQMVRPDMLKAAARRKAPPRNYYNIQARAAADAAVAAEVAAAVASGHSSSFGTKGVIEKTSSSAYRARIWGQPVIANVSHLGRPMTARWQQPLQLT